MTETLQIPFFDYRELFRSHETDLTGVLTDVCRRGAFILQEDCAEFERNLADFLGVRHLIGVANGTDALMLGLKAIGIAPGDEVILPSHTYIASAAAVKFLEAKPVLAECGPDHLLDPEDLERCISARSRAVMPVHLNGRTCDMEAIGSVAERHGLMIVEDAAQALGSRFDGRAAGTFGEFGALSFYPAKLLGCFGDGGAVVCEDDEVAEKVRLLRDHGRDELGRVVAWGHNSRLDNLHAAVLNHKLDAFPEVIRRRREIASKYYAGLEGVEGIDLPPGPDADPRHFDVFQNFELEADRRDLLKDYLERNGIGTMVQWSGTPLHQFRELGFTDDLPRTDAVFRRCLMLPMNPFLTDHQVDRIIETVRAFS